MRTHAGSRIRDLDQEVEDLECIELASENISTIT
jgi:hypothetical protein